MKVYIVAGEPSGDLLASGLMRALRRLDPTVEFRGVGGESMMAVGGGAPFKSLFDIAEISVMGFFEVVPRLPLIARRIGETVKDIEEFAPDVLVTVDSWGFVSELLGRLQKRGSKVPVVHYVAPQVWAWKKGRARSVARKVDRLMTLLPDEGRWFEPHGLRTDFVGHPVVERISEGAFNGEAFRREVGIPLDATIISVLPGSRHSEVKRLLPILKDTVTRVARSLPNIHVVVPTVPGVEAEVRRAFEGFAVPTVVVTGEVNRYTAFAASDLAISKSGTVSLELAAIGVPHMIVYTFGRVSDFLAVRLIKVPYANLLNLMSGREIIPEFVLQNARPELIAECAERLLTEPQVADRQVAEAQEAMRQLRLPDVLPSRRAAEIVLEVAEKVETP